MNPAAFLIGMGLLCIAVSAVGCNAQSNPEYARAREAAQGFSATTVDQTAPMKFGADVKVFTDPGSGCEYLVAPRYNTLTRRMNHTSVGDRQMGCR